MRAIVSDLIAAYPIRGDPYHSQNEEHFYKSIIQHARLVLFLVRKMGKMITIWRLDFIPSIFGKYYENSLLQKSYKKENNKIRIFVKPLKPRRT